MQIQDFIKNKDNINNLRSKWPVEVLNFLKSEREKAVKWVEVAVLDSKEKGIKDTTHKVEKRGDKYVQLELRADLNAYIYKNIGYTESELNGIIKNIEFNIH